MICLFESSTCFEKLCAYPQKNNRINTTSGIITLKTIEWSKIARIHRKLITICSGNYSNFRPLNCFQSNYTRSCINTLNPELNPICYLLALLAHHFLHVSRIMVKSLTLTLLMSYIYGAHILDVSRSHTTTQHSR